MSQTPSPYAQFGTPQQYGGDFIDPAPTRTSVLAITGLVVSIVGCIACAIPGPGAIAAILGGLGLFFVTRSRGRLTGTGIAVTAIVLGLFQSVFSIAFVTGLMQVNNTLGQKISTPVGAMMTEVEGGDYRTFRTHLSKSVEPAVTDDMIKDFVKRYHDQVGTFQRTPQTLYETLSLFMTVVRNAKGQNGGPPGSMQTGEPTIPMPAFFSKQSALIAVVMDARTMGQPRPAHGAFDSVLNIGIATLDGQETWLVDPDLAHRLAHPRPPGAPPGPPGPSGPPDSEGTSPPDAPDGPAPPGNAPPHRHGPAGS